MNEREKQRLNLLMLESNLALKEITKKQRRIQQYRDFMEEINVPIY